MGSRVGHVDRQAHPAKCILRSEIVPIRKQVVVGCPSQAKDAKSKARSAASDTDSHECDDERDEEGSNADFCSSGSSHSSGRDNKPDSQFSRGNRCTELNCEVGC